MPMTHMSIGRDIELAHHIVDRGESTVIIGGHEHEVYDDLVEGEGEREGCRVKIVKTGQDAEKASVIDLEFDEADQLKDISVAFVEMKDYEECPRVKKIADKHMSVISSMEQTNIMTTALLPDFFECRVELSSERTRFQQTTVGATFCQAIKLELEVDACIINGATIKGGAQTYPDGLMSYAQLKKELPFPTKMVVVEMPRNVFKEAVRYSRTNVEEGSADETHPEVEVARRGYLQTDFDWWKGGGSEGADDDMLHVALPRNLMGGFCKIKPLMDFGNDLKERGEYPDGDR